MTDRVPWNTSFTRPAHICEEAKSRRFAHLCDRIPVFLSVVSRFPESIRRRIFHKKMHLNERIVEHPWVFMEMGIDSGNILDVGCCWSLLPIELAGLGFQVWGIDTARYHLSHPNFSFVQGDICNKVFPENFFDRVLAISTVEHIGLGHYDEARGHRRDQLAVREMHRILKPGGAALVSVPFGKKTTTESFRVYDPEALRLLISPFYIKSIRFHVDRGNFWEAATEDVAASRGLDARGRPTGVALAALVKSAAELNGDK